MSSQTPQLYSDFNMQLEQASSAQKKIEKKEKSLLFLVLGGGAYPTEFKTVEVKAETLTQLQNMGIVETFETINDCFGHWDENKYMFPKDVFDWIYQNLWELTESKRTYKEMEGTIMAIKFSFVAKLTQPILLIRNTARNLEDKHPKVEKKMVDLYQYQFKQMRSNFNVSEDGKCTNTYIVTDPKKLHILEQCWSLLDSCVQEKSPIYNSIPAFSYLVYDAPSTAEEEKTDESNTSIGLYLRRRERFCDDLCSRIVEITPEQLARLQTFNLLGRIQKEPIRQNAWQHVTQEQLDFLNSLWKLEYAENPLKFDRNYACYYCNFVFKLPPRPSDQDAVVESKERQQDDTIDLTKNSLTPPLNFVLYLTEFTTGNNNNPVREREVLVPITKDEIETVKKNNIHFKSLDRAGVLEPWQLRQEFQHVPVPYGANESDLLEAFFDRTPVHESKPLRWPVIAISYYSNMIAAARQKRKKPEVSTPKPDAKSTHKNNNKHRNQAL